MTEVRIPKNSVIKYIRNRKGNPIGALVAIKHRTGFRIGYSLCSKHDRFCKHRALQIAIGRSMSHIDSDSDGTDGCVPHAIRKALPEFTRRCERYYHS